MRIKTRIVTLVILALIIIFLSIFVMSNTILKYAFKQIETDIASNTVEIISNNIDSEIERMASPAKDWAKWTATYDFARDRNEQYIIDNLGDTSIKNLKINAIMFSNNKDDIYYSKFYDYIKDEPMTISPGAGSDIQKYIVDIKDSRPLKGLVLIDGKIVLFASENITDSEEIRTTDDSIIFAKYLYEEDLDKIRTYSNKRIRTEITNKTILEMYPQAERLDYNSYTISDEDTLDCMLQLRDIFNRPIGIMHIEIDRGIYLNYQRTMNNYLISFFFISIIIGIVFFMIVKVSVIDKIEHADRQIAKIVSEENTDVKINIVADKEIMDLTDNFNKLMSMLEARKKEVENRNIEIANTNVQLEEANAGLRKVDTLKDNFLSNISHEIRTPLTSLKSYSQLLLSGSFGKLNKSQEDNVKIILESIIQLEHLVNDLLDVSRFESGRMMMHFEREDLNRTIKETVKEFNPIIGKMKGKITLQLDSKHKMIRMDKDRIKQLVRNILSNAVKYHSEQRLVITVSTYLEEKKIMVRIEDNGIGISKEDMKHLFEKFYQVDQGLKRKIGGSGLGLVIIKQIAREHGGNIHVESDIGKGTTVYVQLPYKR